MGELSGKVALITGSSRGIGLATAELFTDEGAKVVMNGRKPDALDEAVESVPGAVGVPGNTGNPAVIDSMVAAALEHFGRLDIAVANAATPGRPTSITEVADDQWQRSMHANLTGPFNVVRAAGRVMAEQGGGSIILVGSIAGDRGLGGQVGYSAAKGGLLGLLATSAKDLGPAGVRVNLILPSAATRAAMSGWTEEQLSALSILKRVGDPKEVAQVISFLGSDRSSFVTGETINVDGGIHLNWGGG